jgi:thiamine pyrophosphate-dependent acetolactate synthase large subunit-like protein
MQKTLLLNLLEKNPKAVFVCSLGTISYDVKELLFNPLSPFRGKVRAVHFVPGAMGCVMGIGLGYALASKEKVIVLVGDGSFLMKLGSMATILKYKPKNLEVHVIQNDKYASTGGQDIFFDEIEEYIPSYFHIHQV